MEDDRSGSKRSMRALPQTPPPPSSRADLGVSAEHRPPSTRNLSSFAQAQEQQSAFAHQRQGSLVSSLTSRSSSEHATELPRAVIEEEEAEDDIPPPPPSLLTASLEDERPLSVVTSGELDRFEVRTAQRVDVTTPASRRDVSSTKPSPDLASRSPRPMASTSTFAPRAKSHDASPLPADASQRIQAASSEPTPSKSSMPSKSTASKRPKDVREPQFPNAKVEKAPTGALYWSKAPVHGRLPYHALRAHTSTLVGSSIWVFGGCDLRACFRDVWRLDLDSFCWSKPKVAGDVPPLCRAHSATLVEGKDGHMRIFIFGGGEGPTYYHDVYCLDTTTLLWSKPTMYGQIPSARRAHAAVYYKDRILVFGGGNGTRALNDCFACNVKNPEAVEWTQLETTGTRPISRGYHTLTRVGSKAVVFGGSDGGECFGDIHVLDLDTLQWTTVDLDPSLSFPRLSHTATQVGSLLYIFGGHNGIDYSNSILVFNLVSLKFEQRTTRGMPPTPRGYATCVYHDSRLILIGGFDGKKIFDETYCLELGTDAYHALITRWQGLLGS